MRPPPRIFSYHAEMIGDGHVDTVAHEAPAMSPADMPTTDEGTIGFRRLADRLVLRGRRGGLGHDVLTGGMALRRRRAALGDRGFPPRPRARGPAPCIPIPVAGEPKKNA